MGAGFLESEGYEIDSLREADSTLDPTDFFPRTGAPAEEKGLLHIAAGGHPVLSRPFLLKIQKEGAFLLIGSRTGAVHFRPGENSRHPVTVRPRHTILIDCTKSFYIQSAVLPWYGDVLLIDGNTSPFQPALFPGKEMYSLLGFSGMYSGLQGLHTSPVGDSLLENRLLTDILTDWAVTAERQEQAATTPSSRKAGREKAAEEGFPVREKEDRILPDYLQVLRRAVLYHPEEDFSLISYENLLGISRYRLCRDYKAAFGISPLQDINAHRLALARDRLLYSGLSIQEIAGICGFASATQFISLFKRQYGMTPGEFRKQNSPLPEKNNRAGKFSSLSDVKRPD